MAGKGSRQRTYGKAFEDNYDRIFGKRTDRMGAEWVAEEQSAPASQTGSKGRGKAMDQYPQEAREDAWRRSQGRSEDV